MMGDWLIYGANGYTGKLTVLEAQRRGFRPILSGRSAGQITRLAAETGLKHHVLNLDEATRLRQHLKDIDVVLNCAGPFSSTAEPMIDACIDTGTHYLDITGEIDVFEYAQSRQADAVKANCIVCPGVGFDVVPTDCLAATLKNAMNDATHLALGFDSRSSLSPGTAKTSISKLPYGGRVRRNGRIEEVPLAYHTRTIDFGAGEKLAMTIPWGDVATAYYTTGIPNIEAYIPATEKLIKRLQLLDNFRGVLAWGWVQNLMVSQIEKKVSGPNKSARDKHNTFVWGEVRNAAGDMRIAKVTTANGYSLTVDASIVISQHVLRNSLPAGAYTPAKLMGANFVSQLDGSSNIEII